MTSGISTVLASSTISRFYTAVGNVGTSSSSSDSRYTSSASSTSIVYSGITAVQIIRSHTGIGSVTALLASTTLSVNSTAFFTVVARVSGGVTFYTRIGTTVGFNITTSRYFVAFVGVHITSLASVISTVSIGHTAVR